MECDWAAKGTVWRPVAALQQTLTRFRPQHCRPYQSTLVNSQVPVQLHPLQLA
jgi:hypothetical protein